MTATPAPARMRAFDRVRQLLRRRTAVAAFGASPVLATAPVACREKPAKAAPAATVQGAVPEAQLASVTLTRDAARRLGIATALVDSADVAPTRTVGGEVVVPPGQALAVSAPVAGTVLAPAQGSIPAAGARVAAGAPLMRLVALPPDRGLVRTGQDLATARARLRQAQLEADRIASLYRDRLVATRDQERAQADLAAAQATYDAAAAQQRLLGSNGRDARLRGAGDLAALTISAPGSGVVRLLNVGPGQVVASGAVLAEVVRLDRLWVRVPLYAGDAASVVRGTPVTVATLGDAGATYRATPVPAPPSADPLAASVDLFYQLDATPAGTAAGAPALRPGERVTVTLPLGTAGSAGDRALDRALVVPLDAIVRDLHGGSWVYVQADTLRFERRRVEVARVAGEGAQARAVLASGPPRGARVVTAGVAELFGTEFGTGK